MTTFVGRERSATGARAALASSRLVTLVGPGGVGKTRLSVEVARTHAGSAGLDVAFVPLADVDNTTVGATVAAAVGLVGQAAADPDASLAQHLEPVAMLIVLDNCEHVLETCADLVVSLLDACPHVRFLCTSRAALRVPGEVTWAVPPLDVPDADEPQLETVEAVRLLCDRARAVAPSFRLTHENRRDVAELCRRLDGLPLAIELAAGRLGSLSPGDLLSRLDQSSSLLATTQRGLDERHRTMTGTLDWSYGLLAPDEQRLLRWLTVFVGGFGLQAALAVGGRAVAGDLLPVLDELVAKSLLQADTTAHESRYRLLETVRQYAQLLQPDDDAEAAASAHAEYMRSLVSDAAAGLTGELQQHWLSRLDQELGNVRAALAWAERTGRCQLGLELAAGMRDYWHIRGWYSEGRRWLSSFLAPGDEGSPVGRRARLAHAFLRAASNDRAALGTLRDCLQQIRESGEVAELSRALHLLGLWEFYTDPRAALPVTAEAVSLARGTHDSWLLADALRVAGWIRVLRGELAPGEAHFAESVDIGLRGGDPRVTALAQVGLGFSATQRLDLPAATAAFDEVQRAGLGIVGTPWTCLNMSFRADALRVSGDFEEARQMLSAAHELAVRRDLPHRQSVALGLLGRVSYDIGDLASARRLFEQALATEVAIFNPWWLWGLGETCLAAGDVDRATKAASECLRQAQKHAHVADEGRARVLQARLALGAGRRDEAHRSLSEGLTCHLATSATVGLLAGLEVAVALLDRVGDAAAARRVARAVEHARARLRVPRPPVDSPSWSLAPPGPEEDEDPFGAHPHAVLRDTARWVLTHAAPRPEDRLWDGLTPSEKQVAVLAGQGLSNPQIARQLFVSPRTVQTHLAHVFAKLDIQSRRDLIRMVSSKDG